MHASFRMEVTMYTILDHVHVKSNRSFHPVSTLVFGAVVVALGYIASSLITSLFLLIALIFIVFTLIEKSMYRKTFVYIAVLCIVYGALRLFLIAITTSTNSSSFHFIEIRFPSWLGSITLGGPVDIDLIYKSALSMSFVTIVIIACCAFSFLIGPSLLVHIIPRRMHRLLETTLISSNVLWRAPNEIRLINEARNNVHTRGRFQNLRNLFPCFISELVSQSCTHAGVVELRSKAIERKRKWYKFYFSKNDLLLFGFLVSLTLLYFGLEMFVG